MAMEIINSRVLRGARAASLAILSLGILGFATSAKAVIILPGQALATTGAATFAGPLVGDTGPVAFTGLDTFNNVVFTGTLDTQVFADTGGLDFVYEISNSANSLDSIQRLTAAGFAPFTTDADYVAGGGNGPFLVSRNSPSGDVIGFSFLSGAAIQPGTLSDLMVIKTNAVAFAPDTVSVSDGGNANVASLAPVTVPEPATAAIAAFGFSALALRRRKNVA